MKKNMLIISYSHLDTDPRVYRQIEAFREKYNVTTLGYSTSGLEGVEHINSYSKDIELTRRLGYRVFRKLYLKQKSYEKLYWGNPLVKDSYNKIKRLKFDIIIANDINTLPLALKAKGNAKLLFDAHEYFPRHFENNLTWKKTYQPYNIYLCKTYMPLTDSIITVSQGIAEEYHKNFNINKPVVITNATDYQILNPSEVNKDLIRIIHHGLASEGREIENMIELMDHLDTRFQLDLMLVPKSKSYYNTLIEMVEKRENVKIIEPVPMHSISSFINNYDIGLSIFPPTTFNLEKSLPNKFFEFIQARLMLAIGPSVEMKKIVDEYKLGVVSKDFSAKAMAHDLNKLDFKSIENYKKNSHLVAKKLNSQVNKEHLDLIVENMMKAKHI